MKIETLSGKIYRQDKDHDPYYRLFMSNTCLRESCYWCSAKGLYHRADITLGDFWGAEKVASDIVDGGGLSLVITHSEKGAKAFKNIQGRCSGHAVEFDEAIRSNPAFFESYSRPASRTQFEKEWNKLSIQRLDWKYTLSAKGKIKRILSKVDVFGLLTRLNR